MSGAPAPARGSRRSAAAPITAIALAASLAAAKAATPARSSEPSPAAAPRLCFSSDTGSEIEASVYSLPSRFFSLDDAERLLHAVRRAAPERDVVVLSDLALSAAPGRHRIDTAGADFTPWPRDPFTLARRGDGGVEVIVRPNLQTGREADARLGDALVAGLTPTLRERWGEPTSSVAPVPFHNGQLLLDDDALWVSLHSVEPRALELLGLRRVPVESFAEPGGAERYAAAARRAADELADFVGRPARFVHPLPAGEGASERIMALGGGAGFDLDSLLTLLRPAAGPPAALVGDVTLGTRMLPPADEPSWDDFRRLYGIALPAASLRERLAAAPPGSRSARLDRFLDAVAEHLAAEGFTVERLPILLVPVPLLGRPELSHPDFVLGWSNVVVEKTAAGRLTAEGFASGLAPIDAEVTRRFATAGAELALLPPLAESVVRNGGYRCASNHLRGADCSVDTTRGATSRRR